MPTVCYNRRKKCGGDTWLAKEAGLLDDGSEELSLTELTAQALLRETEALQKQNFLETYDGVLVSCDSYISLREEPSTDAARLRTIFDGKVARLLDVYDDTWYEVSYGTDTGFVLAEYCEPVHYADYEGTSATSTLIEDIIAKAHANAEDERSAIYAAAATSIADLSVSVASKIVGETLDQDGEQRRLIERYIKEAGSLNA